MDKNDELVLVVPSQIIFEKGKWQGFKSENLDYYVDLINKYSFFKRRGDVEDSPDFQQIIPYIIFSCQNKYFLYKYLPKASEQRLIDTYQLGIGGHINPVDGGAGKNILEEGMMREWNEEVEYKGNFLQRKLVGIINDDSRPVEQVHLGLVYHFIGDSENISIKEVEKMSGCMVELQNIGELLKSNDGVWVKIAYDSYVKKQNKCDFLNKYQRDCQKTVKTIGEKDKEIMTWGLGIAGEAGDVAGCIKKTFVHGNDQTAGIRENLGDTLWYIAMVCNFFGWNLEDIFNENIEKLKKRYPAGFSAVDADRTGRVDWNEK